MVYMVNLQPNYDQLKHLKVKKYMHVLFLTD